jgi:signal transduction histidine kinase
VLLLCFFIVKPQDVAINLKLNKAENFVLNDKLDSLDYILNILVKDSSKIFGKDKGRFYFLLGKSFENKNNEDIAFSYYKKAEKLFLLERDSTRYYDLQYEKYLLLKTQGNLVFKKNIKKNLLNYYNFAHAINDDKKLLKAYLGLGLFYNNPKNFSKALIYYDSAINKANILIDTMSLARALTNKGLIYVSPLKKYDSARYFYKRALGYFKHIKKQEKVFVTNLNIGISYKFEKKYKTAIKWFNKADSIPLKKYKNNYKRILYANMTDTYEKLNDYKRAYDYAWKYFDYKDSVDIKAQNVQLTEINTKYETAKKEKENLQLKSDKKDQRLYIYSIIGLFVVSLVVGLLALINLKNKRELAEKEKVLQQQKVVTLIKDHEIKTIDAMMEGQEIERKRIAEDLHDNLGSTLAILKLNFDTFKEKIESEKEDVGMLLSNTEGLLAEAYKKVRSMAHANQAGVLANLGLVESVKKFAKNISIANKTQIEVIDFGLERHLDSNFEIAVFRIIQELVTNIVKHANAKNATIDMTLFDESFGLIVEDDGVGFDFSDNDIKDNGIGLGSIKRRVENLEGQFSVDSNPDVGTTIIIDVPVYTPEI